MGTARIFFRATNETRTDGPALDGPLVLLDHYLKLLGPLVGRTVVLGGRQEARVVSSFPPLHQGRNELIRRKTPEPFVFGWHDDVEPARGTGHKPAFRQTIQSQFCGIPSPEPPQNYDLGLRLTDLPMPVIARRFTEE